MSQRSFASGEITPALYARCDTARYATALRTLRNFYVKRHGGVDNRGGGTFVAEVKDSSKTVRLIPFVFSVDQTYVLEFGDLYMRVHKDGAQVREAAKTITGATKANPCVITAVAHGYTTGDETHIASVGGMTELNGRNFQVTVLTVDTFSLKYLDGSNVNSTSFGAYTSGGTSEKVYEISTSYTEDDVSALELKYTQSADVVILVNQGLNPQELTRTGDTSWTISDAGFAPDAQGPIVNTPTGTAGSTTQRYAVTAIDKDTEEESRPYSWGAVTLNSISGISRANPAVVTVVGHSLVAGDYVEIENDSSWIPSNMYEILGGMYVVGSVTATTFQLVGVDSTNFTAYNSGFAFSWRGPVARVASITAPAAASPITVTWKAAANAKEYNIYRDINGVLGLVGVATGTTFTDVGAAPDTSQRPPSYNVPFRLSGDYPSVVGFIQQRLVFANTANDPEQIKASTIGKFKEFLIDTTVEDDSPITAKMTGQQINEVRHAVELEQPVVFTATREVLLQGNADGVITPFAVSPKTISYHGASSLSPLVVGNTALFVQARGSAVRDLLADSPDGTKGLELSLYAAHLVDGFTIVDWAYQKIPHSVIWAVRSDGTLLSLTYVRDQQIAGWASHDTDGTYESVCCVPEGTEDAVYVVVKRTIGGATKRYVERFASRFVTADTIKDYIGMDSALTYDGTNTSATTMTLSGGVAWGSGETLTLTASSSFFVSSDVGNQIQLYAADGSVVRFTIGAYTSGTVVTGTVNTFVPADLQGAATTTWTKAVDQVTGLWHLEGKAVSILGDGNVVGSPNNDDYDTYTVTDGAVTLDACYGVIHVGLPFVSDLQTLDIDSPGGQTLAGKGKLVNEVALHLEKSRGGFIGTQEPTADNDFRNQLDELPARDDEGYDDPASLRTEAVRVNTRAEWNTNGRVFLRQVDPLPISVLAVAPSGLVEG